MLDIGLSLGWAAGGPVLDPGAPANATAVADPASALALAGAFRDLVDAFAAGQPAAVAPAPASHAVVDATDGKELPAAAEGSPAPVDCPPVVLTARPDATVRALPGAASTTVRRSSVDVDAVPQPVPDEADTDDAGAVVVPVVATVIDIPKALPVAALSIIPTAIPKTEAATIADPSAVETAAPLPASTVERAVAPRVATRSDVFAREFPRATGGHRSAIDLPVAQDAALGPDVTDSAQRLPPARPAPPAPMVSAMATVDVAEALNQAGLSAPALTRILAAISEAQSSGDQDAPAVKTAAALRIAADLQTVRNVVPATSGSQTSESFARDASQQSARMPATPIARFVAASRAMAGVVGPENSGRSSSSPVLPASIFSPASFSSLSGTPLVTLAHLASGALQTMPMSTSAMTALDAGDIGPRTSDQIVQAIRLACSRDGGEAHIRLDPEQFGDLSVSVKVEGNGVVARLNADAPAVREWLQANHSTLREGLAGHDLRLDRLEVQASDKSRESSERDSEKRRQEAHDRPQKRSKRSDTGQVFEIVA